MSLDFVNSLVFWGLFRLFEEVYPFLFGVPHAFQPEATRWCGGPCECSVAAFENHRHVFGRALTFTNLFHCSCYSANHLLEKAGTHQAEAPEKVCRGIVLAGE